MKTLTTIAILAALCMVVSADTITCDCANLAKSKATIKALKSDNLQISSINLSTTYIPAAIRTGCASAGALAELASESEAQKSTRGSTSKKTKLTEKDVLDALVFDTVCVHNLTTQNLAAKDTKKYCKNALNAYFKGASFPTKNKKDDNKARDNYLKAAEDFYGEVSKVLKCKN